MVRFVDKICSRQCQWRLTSAELPQAWWAPALCFCSAVCSLSPGLFHQQVSNYLRGSHDSVSVWLFVVLPRICCRRIGVHPSPEPQDIALNQGHVSGLPVVFLCQLFENNNNPRPGRPENKVQSKEWESGASIHWCQLKLTANFFASRFHPEALS